MNNPYGILRSDLKKLYSTLTNEERAKWAVTAHYSGKGGLPKYINSEKYSDQVADNRVVYALQKTIGKARFDDFVNTLNKPLSVKSNNWNRIHGFPLKKTLMKRKTYY